MKTNTQYVSDAVTVQKYDPNRMVSLPRACGMSEIEWRAHLDNVSIGASTVHVITENVPTRNFPGVEKHSYWKKDRRLKVAKRYRVKNRH